MTIKQVQTNFNFDVDNQLLSCPYNIYTVNSSYPFLAEYKDNKPCWTCQRNASGTGFAIVFTTDITQVEFDLTVDNIDGFCVLVGINSTLPDGSSSRFHLVNVSKSYPSYGNYIWWNPDKARIDDGVLDANKWVHMVIDKSSIKIYDLDNNLLYSRTKPKDIVDIGISSDENYQPYIANMTVTFNYSQNYLDTIGLTSLWAKIKSLFATKTELGSKANDSDVVHKSGDETIAGSKTFSSNIVGNLTGNADTATEATHATSADTATNATNAVNCPNYLPLAGGQMIGDIYKSIDDSFLSLGGSTTYDNGAHLELCGKNYTVNPGGFYIRTKNDSNDKWLAGYADGSLTWNTKSIECIDSSGTNYIRYTNGLQIVFSMVTVAFTNSNTSTTTVTLPVVFKDGNYQVITTNSGGNADYLFDLSVTSLTTTSFAVFCKNSVSISATRNVRYIAIGFWK